MDDKKIMTVRMSPRERFILEEVREALEQKWEEKISAAYAVNYAVAVLHRSEVGDKGIPS